MLRTGCMGTMVVVQVALILTVSFFVLIANKKLDMKSKGLSIFGRAVAGLLWFAAVLVLISGAYSLATGKKDSMKYKKYKMMKMKDWKQHSGMKAPMKAPMHREMKDYRK